MNEANEVKLEIDDREIARINAIREHTTKDKALDMGKIGVWFGSRDNAIIYLAAMTVAISCLAAFVLAWSDSSLRAEVVQAFVTIAIAAAGFMFGASKGGQGH